MDLRVIWSSPVKIASIITFSVLTAGPVAAITENFPGDGLVEIEYPVADLVPYRDRRPKNQLTLNFQYEEFSPLAYRSATLLSGDTTVLNNDTSLISGSIGWKRNIPFMGLELAAFYGNGGRNDTIDGEARTLDLTKYGLKFGVFLETLFKEPYVVPYGSVQAQIWDVSEVTATVNYSHTTNVAIGLQVGALIQLNWIEPESSLQAMNETGLTNSYLDIFAQQYGDPSDAIDPRLSSDFNWGVGLRLDY